ncbi:MAG: signal peptide peptidase SppA [Myxococcales bacterium]|nr:signal peptide peptidase SppA [Myxococcales bacterium]MDH5306417.1 signal peptide peptidase SppA [Myxococcales bacterium]MDH5565902.1 signal peptide peptidase SppA [Myxococcales bacterium]
MTEPVQIVRRIGGNLAQALRWALARAILPRGRGLWISLRLAPPLDEIAAPQLSLHPQPTLFEVLQILDAAGRDAGVDGIFVDLVGAPADWSRTQSLRRALSRVRELGKPVVVWAERLDERGLLLASAATQIWLPEAGQVFLLGVRAETFHLRDLLAHLDVRPEVVRIGSHKTAGEIFTRSSMSPEQREQLDALADAWFGALVDGIAAGRGLEPERVRELIDRGPYTAPAALAAGLVDACVYPDEIERRLDALTPLPPAQRDGPRRAQRVDARTVHALRGADPRWRPLLCEIPRIAYVVARGAIHRGSGSKGIACEALGALLERVRRDESVRAVVLRIDSPGGDALASDLLWRAVSQLRREKPVVASMAGVAASGGYYLASAADAVLAESGTITGSIGVLGGKLNLEGLYRRLGVGRDGVERGARAGLLSEARTFRADERRALRDEMSALYAMFVERVARGRGLSAEAVERVAQGRVWSGSRAAALGLVDGIGGPLEALAKARSLAGLARDRVRVTLHPRHARLPTLAALLRNAR